MKKGPPGVEVKQDHLADLHSAIDALVANEILVGFPDSTADRTEDDGTTPDSDITNAALGYIHDNGQPEVNIPARPFMETGVLSIRDKIEDGFYQMGRKVLSSPHPADVVEKGFHRIGLAAQAGLRMKINEGIPPPLAESTLQARARKGRKGAKEELANRAKGEIPSTQLAKPLIDTGQLRNAITYVIRPRSKRKD